MIACDLCRKHSKCGLPAPGPRDTCHAFVMEGTLNGIMWFAALGPLILLALLVAAIIYGG